MPSKIPLESAQLLPSGVRARFAGTKIHSRQLMWGSKSGDHRSPALGSSTEFAEHRQYSQGDDPRTLDWRVYGKQDRYCVKKYVEETNLQATILLDCSASMAFCGELASRCDAQLLSKLDYAKRLAAILSYQLIRQGDAVGLVQIDSEVRNILPAASKPSHLHRILQALHQMPAQHASKMPALVHRIARQLPPRGIMILISDFLDDPTELSDALHHLKHRRYELLLFHILADEELTFPFSSATRFRDLEELSNAMDVDPNSIRRQYLDQFGKHLKQLERIAGQAQAEYIRFNTREPHDDALANFLASRARR